MGAEDVRDLQTWARHDAAGSGGRLDHHTEMFERKDRYVMLSGHLLARVALILETKFRRFGGAAEGAVFWFRRLGSDVLKSGSLYPAPA